MTLDSQPDTRTLAQEALDKVLAYCAAPEGHDCGEYAFGYLDPDKVKAIIRTGHIERTPYRVREGGSKAWSAVHRYTDTDALRAEIEAMNCDLVHHDGINDETGETFCAGDPGGCFKRDVLALLDARDGATE